MNQGRGDLLILVTKRQTRLTVDHEKKNKNKDRVLEKRKVGWYIIVLFDGSICVACKGFNVIWKV